MNTDEPHEPERDAWLRAALAHAPDADAGAPAALSAAILRAAAERSAPPAPGAWQRLLDAWSWLARPPVAAGFASVMVATVVALMWWDRPMDEAMPRPPAPARAERPAAPAAAPATDPVGARRGEEAAASPAPPPQPAATASRHAATPAQALGKAAASPAAPRVATESTLPPETDAAPNADAAERLKARPIAIAAEPSREQRSDAAPVAEAAQAPATAPAIAAAAPAAVDAAPARTAKLGAAAGVTDQARSRLAMQVPPVPPPVPPTMPPPLSPPAALLSRWPPDATDWRWQAPDGVGPLPAASEARAWLRRLDDATRGRWSAAPTAAASGPTARWWRGEAAMGTLTFEAAGVRWVGSDGQAAFAPLDATTLAALRVY